MTGPPLTGPSASDVLTFLQAHQLAVLATTDERGRPEAALIVVTTLQSFELVFGVLTSYRKYANLRARPEVALVLGWSGAVTVQYEGLAMELSGSDRASHRAAHLARSAPGTARFLEGDDARFFKVSPRWIRYSDFRTTPPQEYVLRLDGNGAPADGLHTQ